MSIEIVQSFDAPVDVVFDILSDHANLGRIWPAKFRVLKASDDKTEPNGVGAVREVKIGPVRLEETVQRFRRNEYLEYSITSGPLIADHRGYMRFWEDGGKSYLAYRIDVQLALPLVSPIVQALMEPAFRQGLEKLAARLAQAEPQQA